MYTLWINNGPSVARPVTVNGCLDTARARAIRYAEEDGASVEIMSAGRVIEVIEPTKKLAEKTKPMSDLASTLYDIAATRID